MVFLARAVVACGDRNGAPRRNAEEVAVVTAVVVHVQPLARRRPLDIAVPAAGAAALFTTRVAHVRTRRGGVAVAPDALVRAHPTSTTTAAREEGASVVRISPNGSTVVTLLDVLSALLHTSAANHIRPIFTAVRHAMPRR